MLILHLMAIRKFFFRHELLQDYKYYWRVEYISWISASCHGLIPSCRPDVTFFCDLHYDPFLYMQDHGKVYGPYFNFICVYDKLRIYVLGFTMSLYEYQPTIPTLWHTTKGWFGILLIHIKDTSKFSEQSFWIHIPSWYMRITRWPSCPMMEGKLTTFAIVSRLVNILPRNLN